MGRQLYLDKTATFTEVPVVETVREILIKTFEHELDKDLYFNRVEEQSEEILYLIYVNVEGRYMSIYEYFKKSYFDYFHLIDNLINVTDLQKIPDVRVKLDSTFKKILTFRGDVFIGDDYTIFRFVGDSKVPIGVGRR